MKGLASGPNPHWGPRNAWSHGLQSLSNRCRALHLSMMNPAGHARLASLGLGTVVLAASAVPVPSPAGQDHSGSKRPSSHQDFWHPKRRATDTFILINCAAFALQWLSKDLLTFWGAKVNALIAAGQWWRLISPAFLHSSAFHLLINCYAMHNIAPQLELVSGSARLSAVYLGSAFTGTVASFLLTPSPSLGASGALFGCGAALAVFYYRHKEVLGSYSDNMLRSLAITLVINMGYSLLVKNVDNWGHIGGAVGGALVAWALGPHFHREPTGRFVDRPPVPLLAYASPLSSSGGSRQAGSRGKAAPRRDRPRQAVGLAGQEGGRRGDTIEGVIEGRADQEPAAQGSGGNSTSRRRFVWLRRLLGQHGEGRAEHRQASQ